MTELLNRLTADPASRTLLAAQASVFALLLLASAITWIKTRRHPDRNYAELKLRIITWWWIVAILTLVFLARRGVAVAILAFVSFLAFKEFLSLVPTRRADRSVLFWAYLTIPLQFLWVWVSWYGMFIIFIPVYAFLMLPARTVLIGETQGFLRATGTLHWGLMTTVFSLSHMAALLMLPQGERSNGLTLLFFLLFLTQANDVAQYIWGKSLGRHKVLPTVSPGKTYEGLLGGLVTTTALAWLLAPWLTPITGAPRFAVGPLLAISGFLGDVVISAVKRDLRLKDSGSLLPGHGGVLDRLDSLTFTAPLFFHFVYYLYFPKLD